VLIPNKRVVEGPFGEAPGYLGPQRYTNLRRVSIRAINYRNGANVPIGHHTRRRQTLDGFAA